MDPLVTLAKIKLQHSRESFVDSKPLKYAPWDAEAAQKRLLTFTFDKWPKRFSEGCDARAAAFKGWTCIEENKLECSVCESILVQPTNIEIEVSREALEKEYSKQLVEGHSPECPWRFGKCSDDIFESFLFENPIKWRRINDCFSECSFGCSRVLNDSETQLHRWFCPFVYKKN